MGASESFELKKEIIKSNIWKECNIYELENYRVVKHMNSNITIKYTLEYISSNGDDYYNISKNILFLDNITEQKCVLFMKPDNDNFTSPCIDMTINMSDANKPLKSSMIMASDCFNNYKGKRGVEGIMRIRLDLFNYFTNILGFKNIYMEISDVAKVPLKSARVPGEKHLMVSRMMNPHIKYFSIYDKYAEPFEYTESIKTIAADLRNMTYDDVVKNHNCFIESKSNNYAGRLLYSVLEESESIKEDDERYSNTNCQQRFVDLWYKQLGSEIIDDVTSKEVWDTDPNSVRKLTFDSLRKYFESQ